MKRVLLVLPFALAACASDVIAPKESFVKAGASMSARDEPATCESMKKIAGVWQKVTVARGFDLLGYNRCARLFNAAADGVDGVLDGTVWGDPTYAADHLVMKWNAEWDRGNAEDWSIPPYAAWETNEWNGKVRGGSGAVWHYKIKWVGACGTVGTPLPDGGYCVWSQFDVLMDQGFDVSFGDGHLWFAHAKPNGFGLKVSGPTP